MRGVWIGTMAVAASLALPAMASAGVTCDYNSNEDRIDVTITNGTPSADLELVGGVFTVVAGGTGTECTGSSTSNVDSIAVTEAGSAQGTAFGLDFVGGRFGPGTTPEGTDASEIEVTYTADATGNDILEIEADNESEDQDFRFGSPSASVLGANLNGDGDNDDVSATGVDSIFVWPGSGDDVITADGTGTAPFPASVAAEQIVQASFGNDTITASATAPTGNNLDGGPGNDVLTGGPGNDDLEIALGDDTADGNGGSDFASYSQLNLPGVTLDLSNPDPQNTGSAGIDTVTEIENIVGSNGDDVLTGTSGANVLFGGNSPGDTGDDVLIGLGGNDTLNGRPGDDLLIGGADNDILRGEPGTDTVSFATGSTGAVGFSLALALTGMGQVTGGAGTDTLADSTLDVDTDHDVENLTGSPFGGDTLLGNDLANVLTGWGDSLMDTIDCAGTGDGDLAVLDELGIDAAANCETIDNAPQTTIQGGPADGATLSDSTPTYDLTADELADFEVRVGTGPFTACSPSCSPSALSDGTHALEFRAVDVDESGNPDASPASRTITIDTTAPNTTITKGPQRRTTRNRVRIRFQANEAAEFECKLDRQPYRDCDSPFTKRVRDGRHTFRVRGTDGAGNVETTPAKRTFRVL